jgi:AraC-like DNA-binding protein
MRKLPVNLRMRYLEHPVPEDLRSHIACLWHLTDPAPAGVLQTIYPDGCCELIVHLAKPPRGWDAQRGWHDQAATLFAAQHLSPVKLRAEGPLDCVGLRLQSEVSTTLGGLTRVRDRILDLAEVDPGLSRALRRAVGRFIAGQPSPLWSLVERRIAGTPVDVMVAAAVARLRAQAGSTRIDHLAKSLKVGVRSLQTRFRRQVGLTPKEFARVVRLRATLRALDEGSASISDLAADAGFADQAHAARELRRVTGLAPARLRAAMRADPDGEVAVRLAAAFVRGGSS